LGGLHAYAGHQAVYLRGATERAHARLYPLAQEKYTLRYTGGMVPDVFQIIVKEKGVFTNITSPSSKAKLRILFEAAPIGLLIENAGGASSMEGKSILDIPIDAYDQRTQVCDPRGNPPASSPPPSASRAPRPLYPLVPSPLADHVRVQGRDRFRGEDSLREVGAVRWYRLCLRLCLSCFRSCY